ncbi:MAG: hypothetical protein O7G85_12205 [Planctomycetota bacterium]|nr:hypothetical protein [Planctomycetota bacterium]
MLIYAGIDEAGYGPMLGPLCVACSAFVIPNHDPEQGKIDLWHQLRGAVCRKKSDKKHRLAIDDSKNLKGAKKGKAHPLLNLERGVLSFLAQGNELSPCDDDVFRMLGTSLPEEPWYESSTDLPVANQPDQLRIASARLHLSMTDEGIVLGYSGCEMIDVASFNEQVEQSGTKAAVNFTAAMRHVDRIWKQWPDAHPRVLIDRHGGRTHYRELLQFAFPEAFIRIVAEEPSISRYVLQHGDSSLTISFLTEAEKKHLPVALASMIAKYMRELAMIRMNRHFQGLQPQLEPTAGYVQDARRYLADLKPVLEACRVDRRCLVRSC